MGGRLPVREWALGCTGDLIRELFLGLLVGRGPGMMSPFSPATLKFKGTRGAPRWLRGLGVRPLISAQVSSSPMGFSLPPSLSLLHLGARSLSK